MENIPEVKEIYGIITERTVIAPYQVDMILSIARRYMIPIHRVLSFFLTRPIIKRLEKYGYDVLTEVGTSPKERVKTKNTLVFFGETIITPTILEEYMREMTVVICPDDFSLENYRQHFEDESTFFFSSDLTDTRKAKAWIDIQNGKYKQIF